MNKLILAVIFAFSLLVSVIAGGVYAQSSSPTPTSTTVAVPSGAPVTGFGR